MNSLMVKHSMTLGEHKLLVTCTGQRSGNDHFGNPVYLVQLWTHGTLYYPKVRGYRERKDNSYKLIGYDLNVLIAEFVKELERQLKEEYYTSSHL